MAEKEVSFVGFKPPEIAPPPEAPIFAKEKLSLLGKIPIMYASWGKPITYEALKKHYRGTPLWTEEVADMIEKVGFSGGFYYPWDFEPKSEQFQERQAHYAAELARQVMNVRHWEGADFLVVASVSCREDTSHKVAEILLREGIKIKKPLFYAQACNGTVAAISDLCRTKDLQGSRAVVVGIESLSGTMVDPKEIQLIATFGNGGGAIAFQPGVEIEHIVGRTIVEPDKQGVIKAPKIYQLPQNGELVPPAWYEFVDEGGNPIDYEDTSDYFAVSEEGVFLALPESKLRAKMDGLATFKFFASRKRLPTLIADIQERYNAEFKDKYGKLGPAIFHPASQPVIIGVGRSYLELSLLGKGLDVKKAKTLSRVSEEERASLLKEAGIEFSEVRLPWLIKETGINNISAATSLVHTAEMIERGLLKSGVPTPVVSMGIGSVREVDVVIFHE